MEMKFQAGVVYKGKVFFSDIRGFGFFSFDLESKVVRFCAFHRNLMRKDAYRRAILNGDDAWFLPQNSNYITRFNLETFEEEDYPLPYSPIENKPSINIVEGIKSNDKIFCIPFCSDYLTVIVLSTNAITQLEGFMDPTKESFFSVGKRGDNIICYPYEGKRIKIIDPMTMTWQEQQRPDVPFEYSEVAFLENYYAFAPGEGNKLRLENKEYECGGKKDAYFGSAVVGEKLIFLPCTGNDFLQIDLNTHEYSHIMRGSELDYEKPYDLMRLDSEKGVFYSASMVGGIVEIKNTGRIEAYLVNADLMRLKSEISKKAKPDQLRELFKKSQATAFFKEDDLYSFRGFLKYV